MSLKDKVMIVNLTISQWGARKYDEKASKEVEAFHNAHEAGRFNKILIKSETLKEIQSMASKARNIHYEHTLPWGDNGDRILSTESYFRYISEISTVKYQFEQLVEQFVQEYVQLKEEAKFRLGSLYKETDYPHESTVRRKFDLRTIFMPVAEAEDFRLNVSNDMVNMMRTQIEGEVTSRVQKATSSIIERARDVVQKMKEVLSEKDKIFRDSLIGNIQNLVELIPILNFNDDPKVKEIQAKLNLLIVDPDRIRWNNKLRQEMAEKAGEILDSME